MAERSQYQYQPITGPVWREPVAERLAWIPRGQQPARGLPFTLPRSYVLEPILPPVAPYNPAGLEWLLEGQQPARSLLGGRAYTVQPPLVDFDPSTLQWALSGQAPNRPLPRGKLDYFAFVQLAQDAPYDPSTIEWMPKGAWPRVEEKRRLSGEAVQPEFAALYPPEGLQWIPVSMPRNPPEKHYLGDFALAPFAAQFDPASLSWEPIDSYRGREKPWSRQGIWVLDPFPLPNAPYDPSAMEWALSGILVQRVLPAIRTGFWVIDPITPPDPAPVVRIEIDGGAPRKRKSAREELREIISRVVEDRWVKPKAPVPETQALKPVLQVKSAQPNLPFPQPTRLELPPEIKPIPTIYDEEEEIQAMVALGIL